MISQSHSNTTSLQVVFSSSLLIQLWNPIGSSRSKFCLQSRIVFKESILGFCLIGLMMNYIDLFSALPFRISFKIYTICRNSGTFHGAIILNICNIKVIILNV